MCKLCFDTESVPSHGTRYSWPFSNGGTSYASRTTSSVFHQFSCQISAQMFARCARFIVKTGRGVCSSSRQVWSSHHWKVLVLLTVPQWFTNSIMPSLLAQCLPWGVDKTRFLFGILPWSYYGKNCGKIMASVRHGLSSSQILMKFDNALGSMCKTHFLKVVKVMCLVIIGAKIAKMQLLPQFFKLSWNLALMAFVDVQDTESGTKSMVTAFMTKIGGKLWTSLLPCFTNSHEILLDFAFGCSQDTFFDSGRKCLAMIQYSGKCT